MSLTEQVLSQIPGNPEKGLQNADRLWEAMKQNTLPIPETVRQVTEPLEGTDYDVIICGGTLGILIGATLAMRGWRVALLERGTLRGRDQEWNISRPELQIFLKLNLLSSEQLERAIATEYNPARISFPDSADIWVRDVLNVGVDPVFLLETLKNRFLEWGGKLLENTPYKGAIVHPNGVAVETSEHQTLTARLLLDAMGHFSPIVRQARGGRKPDAVCLVVGTCAAGYPNNETGDIFASFTPIKNHCQYFWEAFPARDGRTTYLFTYLDSHPDRPSLSELFEEYFTLLPDYQNVELSQLKFKRTLFGFFPCYRDSPLKTPWNSILPVGDSSGSQSPLSFGGFGAMVRHLDRLTRGIDEALQADALDRDSLALLQPYQPNLSVTWLFQKSMSVGVDRDVEGDRINNLLAAVFRDMERLGDPVLKPFLRDVIRFDPLAKTLFLTGISHPIPVFKVIPQVGLKNLIDWTVHYFNLASYSLLYPLGKTLAPLTQNFSPRRQYYIRRRLDAWCYGSGGDYES